MKQHNLQQYWIDLEIIILSEVRKRKTNYTIRCNLYAQSKIQHTRTYLCNRNKLRHREQTCGYQVGGRTRERRIGNLGLAYAYYYIQNG